MRVSWAGWRGPPLAAPVECGIDHRAQAARTARCRARRTPGRRPDRRPGSRTARPPMCSCRPIAFAYGSSSSLLGLKRKPGVRIVGTVHAVAVELVRPDVGQVQMPGAVGALADADAGLVLARGVEQAQLDRFRAFGEQREIHAPPIPGRPPRKGQPGGLMRSFALGRRAVSLARRQCRLRAAARGAGERHLWCHGVDVLRQRDDGAARGRWLSARPATACRTSAPRAPRRRIDGPAWALAVAHPGQIQSRISGMSSP